MPRNLERGQALEYLGEITSTYKKAKAQHHFEGTDHREFAVVANLITLQRATLLVESGERTVNMVPFSATGFPSVATLISDAEQTIQDYDPSHNESGHTIRDILSDISHINPDSLLNNVESRTHAFMNNISFLKTKELTEEELKTAMNTISYWKNPKSLPSRHFTALREVKGLLVTQKFEDDVGDKWLSAYKFVYINARNSQDGLWQSFFAIFHGEEDNLGWGTVFPHRVLGTGSNNELPLSEKQQSDLDKSLINITYGYQDEEEKILDRLLQSIDPSIYSEHNVAVFETLLGITRDLKKVSSISMQTRYKQLEDLDENELIEAQVSLAQSMKKVDELPQEIADLINSAIKDIIRIEIERWQKKDDTAIVPVKPPTENKLSGLIKKFTKK